MPNVCANGAEPLLCTKPTNLPKRYPRLETAAQSMKTSRSISLSERACLFSEWAELANTVSASPDGLLEQLQGTACADSYSYRNTMATREKRFQPTLHVRDEFGIGNLHAELGT